MSVYFFILDAARFHQEIVPALAASWRQRSFAPCRALCTDLLPHIESFAARYGAGEGVSLLGEVGRGLHFRGDLWRHVGGEVLLYSAVEMPEVQTVPDTLCCLLAPEHYRQDAESRERFAPIQQAHFGSRDLYFGGGFYRPEHAGYNDTDDVARLARYLAGIDPWGWTTADLDLLLDLSTAEDQAEELAFARECLAELRELYQRVLAQGRLIVCEVVDAGRHL
jgi:hypothetical protein